MLIGLPFRWPRTPRMAYSASCMSVLLAFLFGLGQGLLHAVGPDHCAAMATLGSAGPGRHRASLRIALRFALGHAAVLGGVALGIFWIASRL